MPTILDSHSFSAWLLFSASLAHVPCSLKSMDSTFLPSLALGTPLPARVPISAIVCSIVQLIADRARELGKGASRPLESG